MKKLNLLSLFQRDPSTAKKQKKKKADYVYCSPAEGLSKPMLYIGLVLRTLVLYMGVYGITAFICGAAGLTQSDYWQADIVTPGIIALLCIPVAIAAGVASLGRIYALATPVVYVGAFIGFAAINYGNPIDFIINSALRIYNYALYNLSVYYHNVGNLMIEHGYDYTQAELDMNDPHRFAGTFILASIIGFILYFSIQKKTRFFPIVILLTVVFAPILTYNIAVGTSGIAFILVFVCAALGLKVHDFRYGGRAEAIADKKKKAADKKTAKAEKKAKKAAEKKALKEEADRVFDKAIDADMPLKKAKQARRAVYKSHKESKRAEKAKRKAALSLEKKNAKQAKKEKKLRIKDLQSRLKKAPKGSAARDAILSELAAERSDITAKLEEKKIKRKEKALERKEAEKKRQRNSMAGGYTGIGVAVIAFLAVWLPMAIAKAPFMEIKPINDRVQTARAYVTAYLRGSDVDLNDPYAYGVDDLVPRQLSFDPLDLEDRIIFRVDAAAKSNVYLRSWAATYFDWKENKWMSGSYDDLYAYRERFEKGFSPDSIKTDFYKYVYPSSSVIEDENTYKNFSKYGFNVQQIDVWRVRGSSLLLFVPAHMNTDTGLLEYSEYAPTSYKYQNYFDGTYTSFYFRYGRGYGTVSYITALNRADVGSSMASSLEYYNICKDAILASPDATGDEAMAIVYNVEQALNEKNIEFQGTSIADRYYFSMTDKEKKEFIKSIETENEYRLYVEETYSAKSENEAIALIAEEIKARAIEKELAEGKDGILTDHEAVMAIVEYFKGDEFYYTETPNAELVKGKKSVIESFLTDVKQGYCSHFASGAVFLLREMGIAARYVEGYVADDFYSISYAKNRSDVYGTDAHAWVEIYLDGMGWMQYEVTPGKLSEDMYDPNSDTIAPETDDPSTTPEEDESSTDSPFGEEEEEEKKPAPIPDMEIEEEVDDLQWFIRIIIIGLIIAAVGVVIWLIIRYIHNRAWEAMNARYKVIDSAKNRDTYLEEDFDRHTCAKQLNDWILDIFTLIGCEPQQGELPAEFVERIRQDYGDLSKVDVGDVIHAMQKEEFGHGLTFDEQNALAEYLEDIVSSIYAGMSPWQKIVNRYFRRKI